MHYSCYPTLGQSLPISKTTLIIFSPFLLEHYDLLALTYGLNYRLDLSITNIGPAEQRVRSGTNQGHILKDDLPRAYHTFLFI